MFKIKNLEFEVGSAVLRAHVNEETMYWSLSVDTVSAGPIEGEYWKPRAYSERLYPLSGKILNRWGEIALYRAEWDDCYDASTGNPIASIYVFEHNDIYKSIIGFDTVVGESVLLKWEGKCDLFFSDDYDRNLDLHIETDLMFEGIETPTQDEEESRRLVKRFIREGEFEFDPGDGRGYKPLLRPVA